MNSEHKVSLIESSLIPLVDNHKIFKYNFLLVLFGYLEILNIL